MKGNKPALVFEAQTSLLIMRVNLQNEIDILPDSVWLIHFNWLYFAGL
jgi:hypothetical protein